MIRREQITIWNSVPSVVSLMMQAGQVTFPYLSSVRLFNFCGEPLLPSQVAALFQAHPDVSIQNTYGPTEATISMTKETLTRENYKNACRLSVSIGDPIPRMAVHLIGGSHANEGEIVITGPQVAEGYWEDADRTAAVFRAVQVNELETARGYYTGDWAERYGEKIYFKERIDFQVKIRGFRVELDEVATAIRDCGWPVVAVFKRGEALCAVVERVPEKPFDEVALRQAVGHRVDSFAVPERVLMIDRMPRNDNDKLDRKAAASWLDEQVRAGD
jgi:D-alanine--poly(phosphoribitol) ligase subunit 1